LGGVSGYPFVGADFEKYFVLRWSLKYEIASKVQEGLYLIEQFLT